MGKGKGKGGCQEICDGIQCVAGTICCLFIAGPVLISAMLLYFTIALLVVGILFITSAFSDGRGKRVDEFKVAVKNWNDGAVDGWNSFTDNDWTYRMVPAPANCTTALQGQLVKTTTPESARDANALGAEAGESDFTGYTPLSYQEANPQSVGQPGAPGEPPCNLNYNILLKGKSVGTVQIPKSSFQVLDFQGTGCATSSRRSESSQFGADQDLRICSQRCTQQGGQPSGYTYADFKCSVGETPQAVCARVKKAANSWEISDTALPEMPAGATGSGCFLNVRNAGQLQTAQQWEAGQFVSRTSASGPVRVGAMVRHERDPYLYFLDISNGLKDFGLKRTEKVSIGFTCLGLGILLTVTICCCCIVMIRFARSFASGKPAPRPANGVSGALYDVSAKYGNFIPGGAAMGYPVHGPGAYEGTGAPVGGKPAYNGGTSYDTRPPPGYPGASGTSGLHGSGVAPPGETGPMYGRVGDVPAPTPPQGYPSV